MPRPEQRRCAACAHLWRASPVVKPPARPRPLFFNAADNLGLTDQWRRYEAWALCPNCGSDRVSTVTGENHALGVMYRSPEEEEWGRQKDVQKEQRKRKDAEAQQAAAAPLAATQDALSAELIANLRAAGVAAVLCPACGIPNVDEPQACAVCGESLVQ